MLTRDDGLTVDRCASELATAGDVCVELRVFSAVSQVLSVSAATAARLLSANAPIVM